MCGEQRAVPMRPRGAPCSKVLSASKCFMQRLGDQKPPRSNSRTVSERREGAVPSGALSDSLRKARAIHGVGNGKRGRGRNGLPQPSVFPLSLVTEAGGTTMTRILGCYGGAVGGGWQSISVRKCPAGWLSELEGRCPSLAVSS